MSDESRVVAPAADAGRTLHIAIAALSVIFVLFHVYTSGFGQFSPLIQRSVHLGLALAVAYLMFAGAAGRGRAGRGLLIAAAAVALVASLYIAFEDERLSTEFSIIIQPHEMLFALLLLYLVFDSAGRATGIIMPVLALAMVGYTLFGQYLPGTWGHPGFGLNFMMEQLYLGSEGLWGSVTGLSAGLISIFIIFGCFLLVTGATETFMKVALIVAGRSPGGAAKVANVSSALFGMINGAAVANVATVGNFTIPTMKRLGYRPAFAGAVEATASSGGQITPPVMGAGAFIMAELLRVSYLSIAAAALIPSFLFYACIWASIDVEAHREKMKPVAPEDIPTWREVLNPREAFPLLATVGVLVFTMFTGRSANLAAFWAIVTNVTLFLVMGAWTRDAIRHRLGRILDGAMIGARNVIGLVSLLVCAQIILSLIGLTGIGIKISELIMTIGASEGLLVGSVLTLGVALVLGMGMPTTAAYLLAAAVCAPVMTSLGVSPLQAHFFIFYGALLSALTPPVCTAVYTAAVITGTHWWPIAVESMKLAVMKFVMPFYFIFRPEVLLEGSPLDIARVVVIGLVASMLFAIATGGYHRRPVGPATRILCAAAALCAIPPDWVTDILAVAVLLSVMIVQRRRPVAVERHAVG